MKKIVITSVNVMITNVSELEKKFAITSINKKRSVMRIMVKIYEKIDAGNYVQLLAYIGKK